MDSGILRGVEYVLGAIIGLLFLAGVVVGAVGFWLLS